MCETSPGIELDVIGLPELARMWGFTAEKQIVRLVVSFRTLVSQCFQSGRQSVDGMIDRMASRPANLSQQVDDSRVAALCSDTERRFTIARFGRRICLCLD